METTGQNGRSRSLSRITWRTTVAHHPTEDICRAVALPNTPVVNQERPARFAGRAPGVRRWGAGPGAAEDGTTMRVRRCCPVASPGREQCWSGYGPAASSSGDACCLTQPSALPCWLLTE